MRDIGKNIRELRVKKNMTQDELAEKLFVTRQTVSNYETGKSRPDIDMLVKIAELMDCDVNTVLYGIPPETDRSRELKHFCIALAASVTIGFPLIFMDEAQKLWTRSFAGPKIALDFIVLPLFLLALGWTIMQGISLLTKAKPVRFKFGKLIFWLCMILIILYFSTILPLIYHQIKHYLAELYISGLSGPKGWRSGFQYSLAFFNKIFGNLWLFVMGKQWIFFGAGILIWLFRDASLKLKGKAAIPVLTIVFSILLFFSGDSKIILEVENPEELTDVPYGIQVEQWVDENTMS